MALPSTGRESEQQTLPPQTPSTATNTNTLPQRPSASASRPASSQTQAPAEDRRERREPLATAFEGDVARFWSSFWRPE
eukprot:985890-Rhodomonas_salina.1